MTALPYDHYTLEEYFALERASSIRHEYLDGQVYDMAGASLAHITIADNTFFSLRRQANGRDCRVFSDDLRVKTPSERYFYPDTSVVCGEAHFFRYQGLDSLLNPTLIIEILSPTTETFDRGEKFRRYREIESLQEYLLISQTMPLLERFARQPGGDWLVTFVQGLETELVLQSIGCTLTLAEVYENVTFDSSQSDPDEFEAGE